MPLVNASLTLARVKLATTTFGNLFLQSKSRLTTTKKQLTHFEGALIYRAISLSVFVTHLYIMSAKRATNAT